MHPNDNLAPYKYIYVLRLDDFWIMESGYISGAGTWMQARQFQNYPQAKAALADPSWHNDPQGVSRAKVVRLTISITEFKMSPQYFKKE